ncbi:MAG: Rieske 2Fe-2S domain-containing protein [Acidimicrobiia bacterium]|nr:Rieske 2Fe-2S domain-containing protein [Acidimicrobiia bacterium]
MTGALLFAMILILLALISAAAVVAIAARRQDADGPATAGEFDRRAQKADQERKKVAATVGTAPASDAVPAEDVVYVPAPHEFEEDEPRVEISYDDYGVTRRKFFNRAIGAVFGLFILQFALAGLAFFWPKLKGGFGTAIKAGSVSSLKAQVIDGATVTPLFVPAAQAWLVPFEVSRLPGSSFEATPNVVAGGESDGIGLMALWQKCVHLGCRVPDCVSSQGFECPCHGSKYNISGEYSSGPAPRNLDRFAVAVDDAGDFVIDTGTVVQTSRATTFTAVYPQGPFCVG